VDDGAIPDAPGVLDAIQEDTQRLGFGMGSEARTGSLLRTLAASKPGGRFLELGTGTGVGTAWILSGMDSDARLDSVDSDPQVQAVARRHLGHDPRVTFQCVDGATFLQDVQGQTFDLIFADAWPGKFTHLDLALSLLARGGMYLIDDLVPQPSWPDDHAPKVAALIAGLEGRTGFVITKLEWASGLTLLVRR